MLRVVWPETEPMFQISSPHQARPETGPHCCLSSVSTAQARIPPTLPFHISPEQAGKGKGDQRGAVIPAMAPRSETRFSVPLLPGCPITSVCLGLGKFWSEEALCLYLQYFLLSFWLLGISDGHQA